ncbi:DUF5655 domain-containing protein [Sulfurimonas paralvinellae]|uniref:DUF5655 domain-containing protein n=1 Tax=Sulfurimonas paralvinellae TaxID=317658 RepID=A0A7M1BAR9_9BACT|nr:DUF5655 domain-containing protein [Sulfurimonas paralvinellae]QOP45862.1 hypothetical protein FM071_05990 [Sulfurimonas paralvinellae]
MRLFNIGSEKLDEVNQRAFKLEREIQGVTEQNLEMIFGYQFVKSEYSLNNFRLDSLAYDEASNSFVIIEYKRDKNFSVIDQGYAYLSLMLNNKADFILEYNECMNKNLRKNDVDWSQSKVLFIAPSYTLYQRESINFKDLPIELWEIKQFENSTVMYTQINPTKSTESIQTISSDTNIQSVAKEVKTYTEEEHLERKPPEIVELYETIKNEILSLGDIKVKANKQYIAFVGKRNIVDFVIQNKKIKMYINMKFSELDDYKNIVKDITNIGSWGNGDCEVNFSCLDDIDYLISLVKQSYKQNG